MSEPADDIRKYRRATCLSQEGLADAADMSLSTIRKVEQGGDVRVETLHALARALGVRTSDLFVTDSAQPVIDDSANKQYLTVGLRWLSLRQESRSSSTGMTSRTAAIQDLCPLTKINVHSPTAATHSGEGGCQTVLIRPRA